MSRTLAERRDGGRGGAAVCGACEDVHLRWGETTLSLDRASFLELARMVSEAANLIGSEPVKPSAVADRKKTAWTH